MGKEKFDRSKKKFTRLDIGTIGHVDHGKTTLSAAIATVLAKNGFGEAQNFTLISKTLQKKKKRGITISTSHIEYETKTVTTLTLTVQVTRIT